MKREQFAANDFKGASFTASNAKIEQQIPDYEIRLYINSIGIQLDLYQDGEEIRSICRDEVTSTRLSSLLLQTCKMLIDSARPRLFSERRRDSHPRHRRKRMN